MQRIPYSKFKTTRKPESVRRALKKAQWTRLGTIECHNFMKRVSTIYYLKQICKKGRRRPRSVCPGVDMLNQVSLHPRLQNHLSFKSTIAAKQRSKYTHHMLQKKNILEGFLSSCQPCGPCMDAHPHLSKDKRTEAPQLSGLSVSSSWGEGREPPWRSHEESENTNSSKLGKTRLKSHMTRRIMGRLLI